MHTEAHGEYANSARGREARELLRSCVHCGFCLEACPTYRVLGDERDGPRGRIYLIKQMVEGGPAGETRRHLDRCLTCRACETACPSGMQYGRLLEIGREIVDRPEVRPLRERLLRRALVRTLTSPRLLAVLLGAGRSLRPLLPRGLARTVPERRDAGEWPAPRHPRRMGVLEGCVQPALAPTINAAAARVLDGLGISLVPVTGAGCCGALAHHLGEEASAYAAARRSMLACDAALESGCEAIVSTASGCGAMVKDYARLLRDDPEHAAMAKRVAQATRDLCEVIDPTRLASLAQTWPRAARLVLQSPCTLQHGQRLAGRVETLLAAAGYTLAPVADAGLCCGSAGSYSIMQPGLARELRSRKLATLMAGAPAAIATANVGCLVHLAAVAPVPVRHWIEFIDSAR